MTNDQCFLYLSSSGRFFPVLASSQSPTVNVWPSEGHLAWTLCYTSLARNATLAPVVTGIGKKSCLLHYSAGWNTGSVQICVLGRYEAAALSYRWPASPSDSLCPSLLGFPLWTSGRKQRVAMCPSSVLLSSATPSLIPLAFQDVILIWFSSYPTPVPAAPSLLHCCLSLCQSARGWTLPRTWLGVALTTRTQDFRILCVYVYYIFYVLYNTLKIFKAICV